eukprot:7043652-Prymnesium_polylepis.1
MPPCPSPSTSACSIMGVHDAVASCETPLFLSSPLIVLLGALVLREVDQLEPHEQRVVLPVPPQRVRRTRPRRVSEQPGPKVLEPPP